jgi:hypothetical protein
LRDAFLTQGRSGGADEPRVERKPFHPGRFLNPEFEGVRQAKVEPRGPAFVGIRRTDSRWSSVGLRSRSEVIEKLVTGRKGHHKGRLGSAKANFDRARRQFAGYLIGGGGQGLEQDEPGGGLQRGGEPFSQRAGVVTTGVGGYRQFMPEAIHIQG